MRGRNGPWLDPWVWQEQISLCLSGIFRNPVYTPKRLLKATAQVHQHGPLLAAAIFYSGVLCCMFTVPLRQTKTHSSACPVQHLRPEPSRETLAEGEIKR